MPHALAAVLVGVALAAPPAPEVPSGFSAMVVTGVVPTDAGPMVMLTDPAQTVVLPIQVGESEALSISFRARRKRFPRPLTHDLLDTLVTQLGGELVQVRIDDIVDGAFSATLYVRQKRRLQTVDARASDAIALALGRQLDIWVSDAVVDQAGVRPGPIFQTDGAPPADSPPIERL